MIQQFTRLGWGGAFVEIMATLLENSTDPAIALSNWYVAHCKPFREITVATALEESLGLAVYLPTVKRLLRGQAQSTPLFPGYLFVQTELYARTTSAINAVPGIVRLLAFGGLPQAVPPPVVEGIRERVDRLNAQGGMPAILFCEGEPVRLISGPLQGLEAVFLGPLRANERVKILIEFLGQLREVEASSAALEKIGPHSQTKRPRRTRGRGRLIQSH